MSHREESLVWGIKYKYNFTCCHKSYMNFKWFKMILLDDWFWRSKALYQKWYLMKHFKYLPFDCRWCYLWLRWTDEIIWSGDPMFACFEFNKNFRTCSDNRIKLILGGKDEQHDLIKKKSIYTIYKKFNIINMFSQKFNTKI